MLDYIFESRQLDLLLFGGMHCNVNYFRVYNNGSPLNEEQFNENELLDYLGSFAINLRFFMMEMRVGTIVTMRTIYSINRTSHNQLCLTFCKRFFPRQARLKLSRSIYAL